MQTGKQIYSKLSDIFYLEIIVKKMPLSYVKNKYFFDIKDWVHFERLYILWRNVQESYSEIKSREFSIIGLSDSILKLMNFKQQVESLNKTLRDYEDPSKWFGKPPNLYSKNDPKYFRVRDAVEYQVSPFDPTDVREYTWKELTGFHKSDIDEIGELDFLNFHSQVISDEVYNIFKSIQDLNGTGYFTEDELKNKVVEMVGDLTKKIDQQNELIRNSSNFVALSILQIF